MSKTFEYLELHKTEQEERNNFLPTVQLQFKKRRLSGNLSGMFLEALIKDFYEKPELFEDKDFKARVKLTDMLEVMKETSRLLSSERYSLNEKLNNLKGYYEYFKKHKYLRVETPEGKIARKSNLDTAYIVLTDLGVEEFLNLDKKDLTSELKPFVEKYLNQYSFVLEENRQYLEGDSNKIKKELKSQFEEIKPILRFKYKECYNEYKKMVYKFVTLKDDELNDFRNKIVGTEMYEFFRNITYYDSYKKIYTLELEDSEIDAYIERICDRRIQQDEEDFVQKLSLKIAGAIKGREFTIIKEDNQRVNINEDLESYLKIELSDGAKFDVKTQLVGVLNENNTFFYRKPTTFHNVVYSNGVKMKGPSYEKIIKEL